MNGFGITIIGVFCLGVVGLVVRLFWPDKDPEPNESDNWAQHNELRTPSLETNEEAPYDNVEKGFNVAFKGGEY